MDRWRGWAGENPLKFGDFVTRLGTGPKGGGVTGKRSYLGSIFIKSDAKTHAGDVMSTRALLSAARPRTIRVWCENRSSKWRSGDENVGKYALSVARSATDRFGLAALRVG